MIRYTPSSHLSLENFKHPFHQQLDPNNRWVKLAKLVPWDDSLFVDIRKRLGTEEFDRFNDIVIQRSENLKPTRQRIIKGSKDDHKKGSASGGNSSSIEKETPEQKQIPNQGKLKLDASIADQYITPPNDLKLVSRAREETERLVDEIYQKGSFDKKPRTYRRNARKESLALSKKRKKSKSEIRVNIGKQLRYLRRNISAIGKMLDRVEQEGNGFPLNQRDQKIFDQQMYMYQNKVHSHSDRIVNIYRPHVRPMVRRKDKANVEFGSKINISEVEGFVRLDHLGWDNYDEGGDLELQVERFRKLFGCYPELLLADRKYLTKLMKVAVKHGYFFLYSLWRHIRTITLSADTKYYMPVRPKKLIAA